MAEKLLIISDKQTDLALFENLLGDKEYDITTTVFLEHPEAFIQDPSYAAIIVDLDIGIKEIFSWLDFWEKTKSRACLIIYGGNQDADVVATMLQKGVYGFIPRNVLCDRIHETLLGGLENRRAFTEIMDMMDDLKRTNEDMIRERAALKSRNDILSFINRLSSDVSFDVNWKRILPRILNAGVERIIDIRFLSIFYRLYHQWYLDLYIPETGINQEMVTRFKNETVNTFFSLSGMVVSVKDVNLHLYPRNNKVTALFPLRLNNSMAYPLVSGGLHLGMLTVQTSNGALDDPERKELLSTISNILGLSLYNALEYQKLKRMSVKDGLTGILNRKGLTDFLKREFNKARRHQKQLSLIMIDIDNFKSINDNLGHLAGDYVLQEMARCFEHPLRQSDIVARYGGDEFVIVLPETGIEKAEIFLRRLISIIQSHPFCWQSKRIEVGISYGISAISELDDTKGIEGLISIADEKLYQTKRAQGLRYAFAV